MESTLAGDLPDSISIDKTQFAVFGASILFFTSNDLIAYLNCKAVGLLFQPKRPRIFEKNISSVSCEKRYVNMYSNGEFKRCSKFLLMVIIESTEMEKPVINV